MTTKTKTKDEAPSLKTILETAEEVKTALAALNDALSRAHGLNIKVTIAKAAAKYDYNDWTPGTPPNTVPQKFELRRLDFDLK